MTRLALVLALVAAALTAATAAPGGGSRTFYAVRPDPRLCPSPLCGGYWIAAANHARTRCHDGLLRPRCYVAEIVRHDGSVSPTPGSLARGTLSAKEFGGVGKLGVLAIDGLWDPIGRAEPAGRFFRLRDLGIRCVRAPCYSIVANRLNGTARAAVSAVDVGSVPPTERPRVEAALASKNGVLAQGQIAVGESSGRAFIATRYFLASER